MSIQKKLGEKVDLGSPVISSRVNPMSESETDAILAEHLYEAVKDHTNIGRAAGIEIIVATISLFRDYCKDHHLEPTVVNYGRFLADSEFEVIRKARTKLFQKSIKE